MGNPLLRPIPKPPQINDSGKSKGILDDFAVRKNIATREGTIEKVPVNNYDIVNKAYVDDNFLRDDGDTATGTYTFDETTLCINSTNHNVGIGTSNPQGKLEIVKDTLWGTTTPTSGEGDFAFRITEPSGVVGLLAGVSSTLTAGVIQTLDPSNSWQTRPLLLNPVGANVGIGTNAPATSAQLDISSTTGALLIPRMTTTQKNALTAVNGMLVYDSTLNKFQGYENGSWTSLI